jgi:serine/threonine protein kinase
MFQTPPNITRPHSTEHQEEVLISNETEDFSLLLASLCVPYTFSQPYLQVGEIKRKQGWALHLTVIKNDVIKLINRVAPLLINENIAFKIPQTKSIAKDLIDGKFGALYLGKIISIFPSSDDEAFQLAVRLIDLSKDFRGPAILTDFCLQNIVYTRYESYLPVSTPVTDLCFSFPAGIQWPFHNLAGPTLAKQSKLLNGRYYTLSTIYGSFKGNIRKAIYFKRPWNIKACVIKEGKQNMFCDDHGRDATDRLKWQYEVCLELTNAVPIPKPFDYFTENGDAYVAIEFIKGKSMHHWLGDEYRNRIWLDLPDSTKRKILKIVLQAIKITRRMHEHGFIHRDITTNNFIVSRNNKIVPIDLELAWSIRTGLPSPPFLLGTPGYMSPQQAKHETPTTKDDIYSLGAMILESFTNCLPLKLVCTDSKELYTRLLFFTEEITLSRLVVDCLRHDPIQRPEISELETSFISLLGKHENKNDNSVTDSPVATDLEKIRGTVQMAINGLVGQRLHDTKSRWELSSAHSNDVNNEDEQEVDQLDGWHTGTAGLLWTIAIAKQTGFDTTDCDDIYFQNWEKIRYRYSNLQSATNPSLYFGSAGLALVVLEGFKCGLIHQDDQTINLLQNCLSAPNSNLTFAHGITGQGMALLSASPWLPSCYVQQLLDSLTTQLISQQEPNGSWNLETESVKKKPNIPLGIDMGISGIILFLLARQEHFPDPGVESALKKALNWLINDRVNKVTWNTIRGKNFKKIWASSRTAVDITILMIKCYEVLGNIQYKQIAELNLRMIPDRFFLSDYSLHKGITRIGEAYLEAYRVFGDAVWLDKAGWIVNILHHSFIKKTTTTGHWIVSTDLHPIADLFRGNGGLIHFLLRFISKGKINIPFLPQKQIAQSGETENL